MPEPTNMYQLFQKFAWQNLLDINEQESYIKIAGSEEYILKKEQDFFMINFYDFDKIQNKIMKREKYITLFVHKDLDPLEFRDN